MIRYFYQLLLVSCLTISISGQAQTPANQRLDITPALDYFSYCSNGYCRLINGDFFHKARNMPVDLTVKCKKNNQYALTFDDGPSKNYPRLLDILKKYNVKATFFVVGNNLQNEEARQWFRQAFLDGHFMANHTFKHEDLTALTEQEIVDTIEKTREAMLNAAYPDKHNLSLEYDAFPEQDIKRLDASSKVLRPPFGNIDMTIDKILKAHGYMSVRWNADRYDWDMPGNDPNTTKMIIARVNQQLDYIRENTSQGKLFNQSIIDLNHDWQPTTVDAIEELITLVRAKGYEFVTLDECLAE